MSDTMTLVRPSINTDLKLPPQAKQVLRHLEKGNDITPLKAVMVFQMIGSSLAGAIHDIRNAGHDVTSTMCRDPKGHKYAEYRLNKPLRLS